MSKNFQNKIISIKITSSFVLCTREIFAFFVRKKNFILPHFVYIYKTIAKLKTTYTLPDEKELFALLSQGNQLPLTNIFDYYELRIYLLVLKIKQKLLEKELPTISFI